MVELVATHKLSAEHADPIKTALLSPTVHQFATEARSKEHSGRVRQIDDVVDDEGEKDKRITVSADIYVSTVVMAAKRAIPQEVAGGRGGDERDGRAVGLHHAQIDRLRALARACGSSTHARGWPHEPLRNCAQIAVPSRFFFIVMGPRGGISQYRDIGRAMATLVSDRVCSDLL